MQPAEKKEKVTQPEWFPPQGGVSTGTVGLRDQQLTRSGLLVYNSLTSSLVPFIPREGRKVSFYVCGPTTYDSAHLGHARNYLSFDIIRRILEDYFNYDVFSVMNITDVDDKIILKARRAYLFDKYVKEHIQWTDEVKNDVKSAWDKYTESVKKKYDGMDKSKPEDAELVFALNRAKEAEHNRSEIAKMLQADAPLSEVLQRSYDALAQLLDGRDGATVKDQKIFRELAAKYEEEFLEDMRRLGVRPSHALTRVTEYMPEILEYVQKIIENGFAYASKGSVYFDTQAFSNKQPYAKLAPWSVGNTELLEEGEGALSKTAAGEKRHPNDFALWKASKPGEPSWDSPWGPGRPGWHIECSAMSSALLGKVLDVHCGGVDLKFPHHDNEIAQSEAYFNEKQWVNYFLHGGHLHIEGLKMSKSLKNFITIRDSLKKYSARQLRLLFLISRPSWNATINYAESTMAEVKKKEAAFSEFFIMVRNVVRTDKETGNQHWAKRDFELHRALEATEASVDARLKNNFDTPGVIEDLLGLVNKTNVYVLDPKDRKSFLLLKVAQYISRILKVFGLIPDSEIGFSTEESGASREQILAPILDIIAQFRSSVRQAARDKSDLSVFLQLCDKLRNESLAPHGVRLEDDAQFPWKLVNAEEWMRELAAKAQAERDSKVKKNDARIARVSSELEKAGYAGRTPPEKLYANGDYILNEQGVPVKRANGDKISPQEEKKIQKAIENQRKKHEEYLKKYAVDPKFYDERAAEIAKLQTENAALQKHS